MRRLNLLVATLLILPPAGVRADEFWPQVTPAGGYELYDLSTLRRTPIGFSIVSVGVGNHYPDVFGRVSYRVNRQSFDCASGSYRYDAIQEFRQDGSLVDALGPDRAFDFKVVPRNDTANLFAAACRWRTEPYLRVFSGPIVRRASYRSAFLYGEELLSGRPSPRR